MSDNKELLPEVKTFLGSDPVKMFIGGQFVDAADGGVFQTYDPGDGSVLANVVKGEAVDIDRAVKAAREAFDNSGWATMPAEDRAERINRLADLVDEHRAILVQLESLDVGKPLAQADGFDVPDVAQTLRYYADLSTKTPLKEPITIADHEAYRCRFPYGVIGLVLPWNFPLLLVGWNVAPILAAGNTVVIKPAEDTPLSTLYFCRLVHEAGIPDGVVNVVTGLGETAGAALANHAGINRMGFTGSPEVGKLIAKACGQNLVPVKLELGGKGAAVVFEDTDPQAVAAQLVAAVTLNTGQVCCTATRWFVHEKIADEFISAAKEKMAAINIGHGLDAATEMGPVVSEKQRARILDYLDRGQAEGAEAILPGGKAQVEGHPNGFYVKPALLAGDPENVCAREEVFGPVAYILKFQTEAEVIELVNRLPYGLANSVWTADLERGMRVAQAMEAGNGWINAHNVFPHGVTYAGVNLSGLGGGVLGPDTLLDYLRTESVVRPLDK